MANLLFACRFKIGYFCLFVQLNIVSGSSKKRTLYRLKYILRLSCARTLARKHKSTVRTFMQRLGWAFLEEFFMEEEQVFSLMFTKTTLFLSVDHTLSVFGIWRICFLHVDSKWDIFVYLFN